MVFTEQDVQSLVSLIEKLEDRLCDMVAQYIILEAEIFGGPIRPCRADVRRTLASTFCKGIPAQMFSICVLGRRDEQAGLPVPVSALWSDDWLDAYRQKWTQGIESEKEEQERYEHLKAIYEGEEYARLRAKYERK